MPSKSKEVRLAQKSQWETRLTERLSLLTEKGFSPEEISKDRAIRGLRAKLRETGARLRAIGEIEKQTAELAQKKAEKAAAPKKDKGKKKEAEEAQAESKRQQKKKKKKEDKGAEDQPST